jgi:ppGpp synthetase/RelA/SpoT-type nucleotidyltranferase
MNSNRGIFEQDVNEFLQLNRRKYEHLLTSLVHTLERKLDTFDALGRIYRIYSRSDKQSGEIFKDAWKIMYKVNKERSKNPDFRIHEVGDIIGLTVVVPYPSDIDFVRHCIDEAIERDEFLSFLNSNEQGTTVYGEKKDDRGYHAYHYQLGINLSEYENARCELQIKTLLHDAWGAKTHDLTYKPAGEVDERLRIQIQAWVMIWQGSISEVRGYLI